MTWLSKFKNPNVEEGYDIYSFEDMLKWRDTLYTKAISLEKQIEVLESEQDQIRHIESRFKTQWVFDIKCLEEIKPGYSEILKLSSNTAWTEFLKQIRDKQTDSASRTLHDNMEEKRNKRVNLLKLKHEELKTEMVEIQTLGYQVK